MLVIFGAVFALVIAVEFGILSILGLVLALANLHYGSPRKVLAALGGRVITDGEYPQLFNILEGLCIENGLSVPEVRLLDDPGTNALILGKGHGETALVCTKGLLGNLDRIALQAVVADELASWKQGDLDVASVIGIALGSFAALSERAASLAWHFTDPSRHFRADRAACRMTRYPPGLHAALETLNAGTTTPRGLSPVVARLTAPYWLVPLPLGQRGLPRPGELDLDLRIAAVAEL